MALFHDAPPAGVAYGACASQVNFGIDYPETPVFLYGLIGDGVSRARCTTLDEHRAIILCEQDAGAGASSAESGRIGWMALPNGRLWPVAESEASEDEDTEEPKLPLPVQGGGAEEDAAQDGMQPSSVEADVLVSADESPEVQPQPETEEAPNTGNA